MYGFHPQKNKATQVKNYANGGIVKGPGSGTSDDVPAMVPRDGYVLPADSTKALGFRPGMRPAEAPQGAGPTLGFRPGAKRVQLSNGEAVLTPEQVQQAGGVQALEAMKNATHTPVPEQGVEAPRFFFANGGPLDEERQAALSQPANNSFGDAAAAAANPAVTQVLTGQPPSGAFAAQPAARAAGFPVRGQAQTTPSAVAATGMPEKPGTPAAQANMQAPVSQPQTQGFTPGVYQHGRSQFSDSPDGMGFSKGFTGRPNAQNSAAADALATRSMAGFQPNQQAATPAAPAASQNFTPPDTGQGHGYGLLNTNRIAMRNAMIDVQQGDLGARTALAGLLNQQAAAPGQQLDREKMAADTASGNADRALKSEELQSARGFRSGQLANDTARVALEATSPDRQGQSVIQAMKARISQEQDPAKRQGLVQHMRDLDGKTAPATTPPAGFRWTANGQSLEPIPGGPAAIAQTEERRTRDSAHDQTRQTIGTINRLMEHPGRMGATGTWNLGRMVPGSDASDFGAEVETLKAQTFLPMVQQLRGMGALSNAEGEKLNAAVGALRFDMSEKAFNESLSRIRDQFGSALGRAGVDVKDMQSWGLAPKQQAASAQAGQQQRTINRAGTLNGRRVVEYSDGSIGYAD